MDEPREIKPGEVVPLNEYVVIKLSVGEVASMDKDGRLVITKG